MFKCKENWRKVKESKKAFAQSFDFNKSINVFIYSHTLDRYNINRHTHENICLQTDIYIYS